MTRIVLLLLAAAALVGCDRAAPEAALTETVRPAPLKLTVEASGTLKATTSTPLVVPGKRWSGRKLVWLAEEGARVSAGAVVARFSDAQSRQDLAEAELDRERSIIARLGKEAELGQTRGQLGVDLADVDWQLAIADRYANASFEALARNEVLDAVQDKKYLGARQDVLEWRQDQSATRGAAELAMLDAKRATLDLEVRQKQEDLDALELVAPHAGIFMLEPDWSGEKPQVGANLFGGTPLASLPDTAHMDLEIAVPQVQAQGIEPGARVRMHPLGEPGQVAEAVLERVSAAAQTRSRESPVKYVIMRTTVPEEAIAAYGWKPGQQFVARITTWQGEDAISVPNLAIDTADGAPRVFVLAGGKARPRTVQLGARGADRTHVTGGLERGERVLIERPRSTGP